MDKDSYEKYVKTDCWSLRRQAYLKRHSICEGCGQVKDLQVHHLTYERLGCELDGDLFAVCENCHRTFHGLPMGTPTVWILQRVEHMVDQKKREVVLGWLH
jgi:5-methylcytosine-specific restriction endonuclease McrA